MPHAQRGGDQRPSAQHNQALQTGQPNCGFSFRLGQTSLHVCRITPRAGWQTGPPSRHAPAIATCLLGRAQRSRTDRLPGRGTQLTFQGRRIFTGALSGHRSACLDRWRCGRRNDLTSKFRWISPLYDLVAERVKWRSQEHVRKSARQDCSDCPTHAGAQHALRSQGHRDMPGPAVGLGREAINCRKT